MRYKIWEKDDFFEIAGKRIDMNPAVAFFAPYDRLPVFFNFDHEKDPLGGLTDVRFEDGEITGELEILDEHLTDEMIEEWGLRLGGWYKEVKKNDDGTVVLSCKLIAASVIMKHDVPGIPKMTS